MTIHSSHPFADPNPDPVRRFRGRLGGTVTLWTAGVGESRAGLTVSSVMIANGEPAHVLGLVDVDSDLLARLIETRVCVVGLLEWAHRDLAEAFAGTAPAPGGAFRAAGFTDSEWGPVLDGVSGWLGVRLATEPAEVGWSMLVDGTVEHLWLGEPGEPLVHRRGRYLPPR